MLCGEGVSGIGAEKQNVGALEILSSCHKKKRLALSPFFFSLPSPALQHSTVETVEIRHADQQDYSVCQPVFAILTEVQTDIISWTKVQMLHSLISPSLLYPRETFSLGWLLYSIHHMHVAIFNCFSTPVCCVVCPTSTSTSDRRTTRCPSSRT